MTIRSLLHLPEPTEEPDDIEQWIAGLSQAEADTTEPDSTADTTQGVEQ